MTEQLADGRVFIDRPTEAVARLTINNPDKRNAMDMEILGAITYACKELDNGIETRCLIITGCEGMFSAGYDIADIPTDKFAEEAERLVAHPFHEAITAIEDFPFPTIAAVNGHALGGGLEVAVSCDLRVASLKAKMGMPPAKLGLIYSHTGLQKFLELIGTGYTKEIFYTGDLMNGERAEAIGLVNSAVDPEEVEAASVELAKTIAGNAPLSQKGNKRIIKELMGFTRLSPELEEELITLRRSCFETDDFREGVTAFGEKRKPIWQGK